MMKEEKKPASTSAGFQFTIPKALLEEFAQNPRIAHIHFPQGLPIDPGLLKKAGLFQKLVEDEEFLNNFQVMIVPKNI